MSNGSTPRLRKLGRLLLRYRVLVLTFIILALLPAVLSIWWTTRWLYQPLLLIFWGLLATQVATSAAKWFFQDAVRRQRVELSPEVGDSPEILEQKEKLQQVIVERSNLHKAANEALESFLSQVVGAWAAAILTIGLTSVFIARGLLTGVENPAWAVTTVLIIVGALAAWSVLLLPTNAFSARSILRHYGRQAWYPPPGGLTYFRIATLATYSALVIILQSPSPRPQIEAPPSQPLRIDTNGISKPATNGIK